jgi:hypothetical protein
VFLEDDHGKSLELKLEGGTAGEYQRFFVLFEGHEVSLRTEGQATRRFELEVTAPTRLRLGLGDNGGPADYMNLYVRDIDRGQR